MMGMSESTVAIGAIPLSQSHERDVDADNIERMTFLYSTAQHTTSDNVFFLENYSYNKANSAHWLAGWLTMGHGSVSERLQCCVCAPFCARKMLVKYPRTRIRHSMGSYAQLQGLWNGWTQTSLNQGKCKQKYNWSSVSF